METIRTETPGKIGNCNARFWTRPDIERARRLIDLYASLYWHMRHAGEVPGDSRALTDDCVFDRIRDVPVLQATSVRTFNRGGSHPSFEAKLLVSNLVGTDSILEGLLTWIYPRTGPYARESGYSSYRPERWVKERLAGYRGKDPGRVLDDSLKRMHRQFLLRLRDAIRSV